MYKLNLYKLVEICMKSVVFNNIRLDVATRGLRVWDRDQGYQVVLSHEIMRPTTPSPN